MKSRQKTKELYKAFREENPRNSGLAIKEFNIIYNEYMRGKK